MNESVGEKVAEVLSQQVISNISEAGAGVRPALSWDDPYQINADLHCHSTVSDGTLSPEELAARAAAAGVQVWSLTDHDEVGGLARAKAAAHAHGILFIPGVEISVTWAGKTLHIVGLNVKYENSVLEKSLEQVRSGRLERAKEMSRQLEKVGIDGVYEGALKYVGNPNLISRTHFARCLVERKICSDIRDVFARYLTPGKPGYVPHDWASLRESVEWILASDGIPVIAHPGRYDINELQMDELITQFKNLGGIGIEVVTGSHTIDQYTRYARRALVAGLKASRGSDFHGPEESRVNLGELPRLPDGCVPIWDNWAQLQPN